MMPGDMERPSQSQSYVGAFGAHNISVPTSGYLPPYPSTLSQAYLPVQPAFSGGAYSQQQQQQAFPFYPRDSNSMFSLLSGACSGWVGGGPCCVTDCY